MEESATRLENLVKAQEAAKEDFTTETERLKAARDREREEYEYNLKQQRKREEEQRKEREDAFKKREEDLKRQETEVVELHKKVAQFPMEIEKAVAKGKDETTAILKREHDVRTEIAAKDATGDKRVLDAKIGFLEGQVASQREEIVSLKREFENATRQVQSIAEKSIEGSAEKQTLKAVSDIALQQAGRPPYRQERS